MNRKLSGKENVLKDKRTLLQMEKKKINVEIPLME